MRREKLNTFVDFPVKGLDLSRYVGQGTTLLILFHTDPLPHGVVCCGAMRCDAGGAEETAPVYDLYAISNHMGGIGAWRGRLPLSCAASLAM